MISRKRNVPFPRSSSQVLPLPVLGPAQLFSTGQMTLTSSSVVPLQSLPTTTTTTSAPIVTTYRRSKIPTLTESHRIPLSIVDVHLRHEQLPFCYFFQETLDETALEESLKSILQDFPQIGGKICGSSHAAIQCEPEDMVGLSFGKINMTLQEWQRKQRGHTLQSAAAITINTTGRKSSDPILLPLFDSLFEKDHDTSLVKIRVTYFENQGTAIGVNFCHALGDTATCVHFVQSWGKQMRQKHYEKVCSDRSKACLSGMMTSDIADIMGLTATPHAIGNSATTKSIVFAENAFYMLQDWFLGATPSLAAVGVPLTATDIAVISDVPVDMERLGALPLAPEPTGISHEYVRLPFPPELLKQLKEVGAFSCLPDKNIDNTSGSSFVSTNDMVTAFGWLMKRHLSDNHCHGISMVVNLRGRSGVKPTMFGNGITHVVAALPETIYSRPGCPTASATTFTNNLCQAAKAIRSALQIGLSDIPNALSMSQMGRALPAPSNSTQSFSTTSWGQFPLYKVRFAEQTISHFHGHPAHPLPVGRTFASVITPCPQGGYYYEMLVPSDRAQEAREMHADMVAMVMAWSQPSMLAAEVNTTVAA